jgi:hypothetical protein
MLTYFQQGVTFDLQKVEYKSIWEVITWMAKK